MAGRNNNKLTPVQCNLRYINSSFSGNLTDLWLDTARGLSIVNRKLFSQEREYLVKNITATFAPSPLYDRINVQVITAGNTWSVHNAWTKAKALHSQMQDLVLEDMPSIEGKWAEFKVYMDATQKAAGIFASPTPVQANDLPFSFGEWDYSTFVMPQHDVDAATGLPLAALEVSGHLCGPDTADSRGLIKAYADSRSTVQPESPAVPVAAENSFYNLLSDTGSQEPELAGVIIDENDRPPYSATSYPGGAANGQGGMLLISKNMNENSPNLNTGSFLAQCGLIHVRINAYLGTEPVVAPVALTLNVHMAKGTYKGLQATHMGQ